MAYIGRTPIIGNYQVLDALVATTTDTYALTKDTVAVFPQTPSNCIVSLNGVIQAPVSSYTISGSDIVFASALTGSDSIDFITVLGDVLSIGTPTDGTVTTAKIADASVTSAKLGSNAVDTQALSLFNASGSAPVYACRAWVNFNGTATVAIRGSGNVSSITDNGTGEYTVNFTTAMTDVNYCVTLGARPISSGTNGRSLLLGTTYSTSAVKVGFINAADSAYLDPDIYCVAVFR
jgi:hypothetical protein